jgi:beta-phosphoglucomutase
MIEGIIFDNEGVVVDTEPIWDQGQGEFLRRRGFVYDRGRVKHLLTGASLEEGAKALMAEYGFSGNPAALARERMEIVFDLVKENAKFIDGFLEFFDKVRAKFRVCIATSMAPELLKVVSDKLGLEKLFGNNIFSLADVHFRSKPEPDLFLYAAKKLRVASARCVVIEDAPLGIKAAKRAEMSCIALTTTYPKKLLSEADLIVDSYDEIDVAKLRYFRNAVIAR